eukprot:TRINITY_DN2428_c0_g2_i1.p1 TRINITY_DN2428_c0_g2~~TRINITY_DN2428_c0_g2_i1.p1  ORF type:complete len:318 (+),score=124.97 TRINITY_DN2428_c0_g2_i1:63-956(+)
MRLAAGCALLLLLGPCAAWRRRHSAPPPREDGPRAELAEHSFAAPFLQQQWRGGLPYWRYGGSAVVLDDAVRLTPDKPDSAGSLANTEPLRLASWQAELRFRVHSRRAAGADGLALWYTEEPVSAAANGPLWGMRADFNGWGLVLDTFDNDRKRDQPGVALIRHEGGPREWDLDHDLLATNTFRCVYEYRNTPRGEWAVLRVTYRSLSRRLEVYLTLPGGEPQFCGRLERYDLPMGYYWSLTAATGALADNHDVRSFVVSTVPGEAGGEKGPAYDPLHERSERARWTGRKERVLPSL